MLTKIFDEIVFGIANFEIGVDGRNNPVFLLMEERVLIFLVKQGFNLFLLITRYSHLKLK